MTKFNSYVVFAIALVGLLSFGCAATGKASAEGDMANVRMTAARNPKVTMSAQAADEELEVQDAAPSQPPQPRQFGMGMPNGGVMGGTVLEGRTHHVRYVPLNRPEISGYITYVANNSGTYHAYHGDGVHTCLRDSVVTPDESGKIVIRQDPSGRVLYLANPGVRLCLTVDPSEACPPTKYSCEVEICATEYSVSNPVVYPMGKRCRSVTIPSPKTGYEIRFDPIS